MLCYLFIHAGCTSEPNTTNATNGKLLFVLVAQGHHGILEYCKLGMFRRQNNSLFRRLG